MQLRGTRRVAVVMIGAAAALVVLIAGAQAQQKRKLGYTDTPLLPGGKWRGHDGTRPQPKIVDPGTAGTAEQPGRPPSDAVVLFDGTSTEKWRDDQGNPSKWKIDNGALVSTAGAGYVYSKDEFGDCQLHVEWATPNPPTGEDQGRGNSGVFFFGRYEIQVLDSFDNE